MDRSQTNAAEAPKEYSLDDLINGRVPRTGDPSQLLAIRLPPEEAEWAIGVLAEHGRKPYYCPATGALAFHGDNDPSQLFAHMSAVEQ